MDSTGESRRVILIVEDLDDIRAGMKRSVESCGHLVLEASNDEEALALAAQSRPDIFLTEEEMPTLRRLLERLHEQPDLRDIPVVIVNPDKEETFDGEIIVLEDFAHLECLLKPSASVIHLE
jgi:CheY-like chemotaxis protein